MCNVSRRGQIADGWTRPKFSRGRGSGSVGGVSGESSTVASPHGINSLPGRVLLLLAHSSGLAKWLKTRPKLTTNTADDDDDGGESRWRQGECHFPDRGACTTAITHGNSLGMEQGRGKWGGHELRLELPLLWIHPHTVSHSKRPLFGAFCLFVYSALRLLKIKIPVAEAVALLLIF